MQRGGGTVQLPVRESQGENPHKISARPLTNNFKRLRLLATVTQTLLMWVLRFLPLYQLYEKLGFFPSMFNKDLETKILQNPQLS